MNSIITSSIFILATILTGSDVHAEDGAPPVNVTVENFVRAESDHMFRANMKAFQVRFGEFTHLREPTTPDNQPVIRMNQDTLYSGTLLDLSKPVTITLPEVGGRYMSCLLYTSDAADDSVLV